MDYVTTKELSKNGTLLIGAFCNTVTPDGLRVLSKWGILGLFQKTPKSPMMPDTKIHSNKADFNNSQIIV